MTAADALILFLACAAAMASPGPGVAALVTRAASVGIAATLPFIAGMVAGDLMLYAVAVAGMAGLHAWTAPLMPILSAAAGLWLIGLGHRQWRQADQPLNTAGGGSGSFVAAWLLTIGNPKTIVFYLALLPTIVGPQDGLSPHGAVMGAAIVAATLATIMLAYAALTRAAMGLLSHPRPLRRLCALVMAGVGGLLLVQAAGSLY